MTIPITKAIVLHCYCASQTTRNNSDHDRQASKVDDTDHEDNSLTTTLPDKNVWYCAQTSSQVIAWPTHGCQIRPLNMAAGMPHQQCQGLCGGYHCRLSKACECVRVHAAPSILY